MDDETLYENLLDDGFTPGDINQFIKSREEGYDIYNKDIKLTTEQLRSFRKFLSDNFAPEFNQKQIREIELGYLKNIDVKQYADKDYPSETMSVLRRALENGINTDLLKELAADAKEMSVISFALRGGMNEDEIKNYTIKELDLMNKYRKKKIDIKSLVDKGFNEPQIKSILESKDRYCIDIEKYVNNEYEPDIILTLGGFLSNHPYEKIKWLFSPKYTLDILSELIIRVDKPYFENLANPDFGHNKIKLLHSLYESNAPLYDIEKVKACNMDDYNYTYISTFLFRGGVFNEVLLDPEVICREISYCDKQTDLDLFVKLRKEDYDCTAIQFIMNAQINGVDISSFITNETTIEKINLIIKTLTIAKEYNREYDNAFFANAISSQKQIDVLKHCFENNIDYKKIDLDVFIWQLNYLKSANMLNELAYDIKPNYSLGQIKSLVSAKSKGLPINHLLREHLDAGYYPIILSMENFNRKSERKIDIDELINLKLQLPELGKLVAKLMSDDLDNNIQAYRQIESYSNKDIDLKENNITK